MAHAGKKIMTTLSARGEALTGYAVGRYATSTTAARIYLVRTGRSTVRCAALIVVVTVGYRGQGGAVRPAEARLAPVRLKIGRRSARPPAG